MQSAIKPTPEERRQRRAAARFFVGVGAASRAMKRYDTETLPLFTLPMIMEAEGLLSRDVRLGRREVRDEA